MNSVNSGASAGDLMEPLSDRLERHVRTLSGPRHWRTSPHGLRRAEDYVELQLQSIGLPVHRQPFSFQGESFENLIATVEGSRPGRQRLLVGAHLDTVRGSPGANDNGSGLAGLIEVARDLAGDPLDVSVDIVAFQLEEWQGRTYRVGSRHFVKKARLEAHRYQGAFVYDMIGCKRTDAGSQVIPRIVSWMGFPTTGDFIAVLGDWKSRRMVRTFKDAARVASPGLAVTGLSVPLRGWPVWHTRRSDNASFWSGGIPSVMITDTGNLRNPRYHRPTDVPDYLDYDFMAEVVAATIQAVRVSGAERE